MQASNLFEGQGKVRASAALASLSGKQNLRADFNLKPSVRGTVKLTSAALARFRAFLPEGLDSMLRQGAVNLRANVDQSSNGTWALTGDIDLANLTLQNQPARASTHFKAGFTPRPRCGLLYLRPRRSRGERDTRRWHGFVRHHAASR